MLLNNYGFFNGDLIPYYWEKKDSFYEGYEETGCSLDLNSIELWPWATVLYHIGSRVAGLLMYFNMHSGQVKGGKKSNLAEKLS